MVSQRSTSLGPGRWVEGAQQTSVVAPRHTRTFTDILPDCLIDNSTCLRSEQRTDAGGQLDGVGKAVANGVV